MDDENNNNPEQRQIGEMHARKLHAVLAQVAVLKEQHSNARLVFLQNEQALVSQIMQADQSASALIREAAGAIGIDLDESAWDFDLRAMTFVPAKAKG